MRLPDSIITAISAIKHPDKRPTIALARSLKGKTGIEIGGPSDFFKQKSYFPAYLYARRIDGVNFNTNTVWEGNIEAGENYKYLRGYSKGTQYITEASELECIPNNSYDFLLSCHSLEHIANPIKTLKRWYEILKPGGKAFIIVPNKEVTFDKNRPYTTFEHLVSDYENNVNEHDNTHIEEVLKLHSIADDEGVKNFEELEKRMKNIFVNRCIHHHVFSLQVMKEIMEYCNFQVIQQKKIHSLNLFTAGIKTK